MLNNVTFAYSNGVLVDSIMADYDNCTELSDKLDEFYMQCVVPEILFGTIFMGENSSFKL